MKKFRTRGVVAVAMIAAMGISTPAIAFGASSSSTASTSTHIALSAHTDGPWKAYRKQENAYLKQLRVINVTFQASVSVARKEYWAAIKASKGSSDRAAARAAARAALTLSIANAMGARSTALVTLGAPPAPPAGGADSAWITSLHGINETYRLAVAAADAAFAAAFPTAVTAPERAVVRATLALAVANAEVARAAALVALGPPPAPKPATTITTVPATTTTTAP
ncbi:MAG TPA: hypothetical protein VII60_03650, partial [Acidimicrobiales bacterium]